MSVRKRSWTTRAGETLEAWLVDYRDQHGVRHVKTFKRKKDADAWADSTGVAVRAGTHTPENRSVTVAKAAEDWLTYVELEGRERSTIEQYRQHVNLHIIPRLGQVKLARLTAPAVESFRDDLLNRDGLLKHLSRPLARKVLTSFKSLLKDAVRRGNVAQNVAAGVTIGTDRRGNGKLRVGVDIPSPDEVRRILGAAKGRWRPFLVTAVFTGMRASELRGLTWANVDLKRGELHVRQRADRWRVIGKPKSSAGERTIPLGPHVLNTLREWRLQCPKSELGLVFPSSRGAIASHASPTSRGLDPALLSAGVVEMVDGKPRPKYGLHALRHFFASWCINRIEDGGLGLDLKRVQELMGHSTLAMTADRYGHLFPRRDDGSQLATAERALLGA